MVDAALQANKEDVTRLVGRDAIAGAWEVLENSDFCCIINPEVKQSTDELYLTFKMLKRRYRSSEENLKLRSLTYFNHPFEKGNEIRLIDDVELPQSLSLESLATVFVAKDDSKQDTAVERPTKEKPQSILKKKETEEYEDFDFSKAMNF